jgi:K+-sensing histidine kinase KdpD
MSRIGLSTPEEGIQTAWFVTSFQLLSLLPVALVSFATLRYGSFDVLLARSVATVATLGVAFTAVTLGDTILDAVMPSGSEPVALGALVVGLLLLVERGAPIAREWSQRAFQSSRQRARGLLDRFGDRLRTILDVDELAQESVQAVGSALDVRSAVVFLQAGRQTPDERWVRAAYRPESPTFTQADLDAVWARIRNQGQVWSRNEELNEADLPLADSERLTRLGVALAIPVTTGPGIPVGLIALGRKDRRLAVYDTEDVERMRALAAQLAVAVERIRLLDRERALVRQTADAEMAALRAQINPHFLFNALNTVAALIRDRPDEAETTVENLAALFRDVLNASGEAEVSLRDEMRLVQRYLSVEEARFRDALEVRISVPTDLLDLHVPAFAVQTLVENAVKHGIERKRGGGAVEVSASRTDNRLLIAVTDSGAGLSPEGATFGVGLSNVLGRLRLLYGDDALLEVSPLDIGVRATIQLPIDSV